MATENVNHPSHYTPGRFECIDVMEDVFGAEETKAFCKLNAFKYLYRAEHKGKALEDVDKAIWYLKKHQEIAMREEDMSIINRV